MRCSAGLWCTATRCRGLGRYSRAGCLSRGTTTRFDLRLAPQNFSTTDRAILCGPRLNIVLLAAQIVLPGTVDLRGDVLGCRQNFTPFANGRRRAYCCGGRFGGGVAGGRGRGRICPQFRPILQSQRPAWGWAVSQQSSGDEGVGATVGEGSAVLVCGTPAPPTPPSARASTAAPPHAAAIALPIRFVMTPNSNFSALNVQSRNAWGKYLAAHIPGPKYVERPGRNMYHFVEP